MKPSEQDAYAVVLHTLHTSPVDISRIMTGMDNYVYRVEMPDGCKIVVRMNVAEKAGQYKAALYWDELLKPLNLPMPSILASKTEVLAGEFPYMVMDFVEGKDLGDVYAELSTDDRRGIAKDIAEVQKRVRGGLPLGHGYGFADAYEDSGLKSSWIEVLSAHLDRSLRWIEEVGIAEVSYVDKVRELLPRYEKYFASVKPWPFLHDTTTKNVMVKDGEMTGIVDVDSVCFGDPLFVPALTKAALLFYPDARSIDYIDFWLDGLNASNEQRRMVDFYTAMHLVSFMGEVGMQFNRDAVEVRTELNFIKLRALEKIFDELVG